MAPSRQVAKLIEIDTIVREQVLHKIKEGLTDLKFAALPDVESLDRAASFFREAADMLTTICDDLAQLADEAES